MPQHPQFRDTPEDSVEELLTIMDLLVQYGLSHEDVLFPTVEAAMNGLYTSAAEACAEEAGEDASMFNATTGQLFEHVEEDQRQQFAVDLRSSISVALGPYTEDPVEAVLSLR